METMDCLVRWAGDMSFLAETGSGHTMVFDSARDVGGRDLAPRPMEGVLAGTGACTAVTVVTILKRNNQSVTGCEVRLHAVRAESEPKVFEKIHFEYVVRGRSLKRQLVENAVKLSSEKYCSASIMLSRSVSMSYEVDVIEDDG